MLAPPIQAVDGQRRLDSTWAIALTACVLIGLAAWRSVLGISFLDDGYYAVATLRLAQGARLFGDEMLVQSLGFLTAVPFAKAWTALFGMTGFVAALRLLYVAFASAVSLLTYRILRPSFGRWPALIGVAVPLLAPVYNLLAVSYDTMAALGMMLALALAFKALRDSSPAAAAAAGAAAAFASISYPPLVAAAVALFVTLAFLGRDRRLVGAMAAAAAAVVVAFAVWLLSQTSIADLKLTYDYVVGAYSVAGPGGRLGYQVGKLWEVLTRSWGVPLWAWFAPASAVGIGAAALGLRFPERNRLRGSVIALLPAALALPVLANWFALGRLASIETLGGNYLISFVALALPSMLVDLRDKESEVRRLLVLSLPAAIVGFIVVETSTSSALSRASGVVGLAPLALASVVWWVRGLRRDTVPAVEAVAVVTLLMVVVTLLFGSSFNDDPPLALRHTIWSGPYAGITTTDSRVVLVTAVERLTARWVGPSTGVLFYGVPGPYLLQRGVMVTNAVWLNTGPVDQATIDYFDRTGRWPDVAFVPTSLITVAGGSRVSSAADPLLAAITGRYRVVERSDVTGLSVFVPVSASAP